MPRLDCFNVSKSNISEQDFPAQPSALYFAIVMFLVGVFSNGLAIFTLLSFKFHKKVERRRSSVTSQVTSYNPTAEGTDPLKPNKKEERSSKFGAFHALVFSLAVLDLVGTISVTPITFLLYSRKTRIKSLGGISLCRYSAFTMMFFGFATMAMVMAMSIERLLSINHAFFHHKWVTAKKAVVVVMGLLTLVSLICILPVLGFGKLRPMFPYTWCFADWNATKSKDKAFNFLYAILGILTLLTTMFCNIKVTAGLLKMRKSGRFNLKRKRAVTMETQMIIQLLVISVIFLLCWLPLMIRIIMNQLDADCCVECDRIAIWMVAINPVLDPWVYILFRNRFRRFVASTTKIIFCHKSSLISTEMTSKLRKRENSIVVDNLRLTVPSPN